MTAWFAGLAAFVVGIIPSALWAPILAVNPDLRPPDVKKEVTIVFGGDLMFDRTIRKRMAEYGESQILTCVGDVLKSADVVVANLEGPITKNPSMSLGSVVGSPENFTFTFPTTTASLLVRHNIHIVNLGNNHILNFGGSGLQETYRWLDAVGVTYFGDPDKTEEERVERVVIQDIQFSFVNWSDWTPVGKTESSNGASKLESIVEQIRKEVAAGRTAIVYTHWGEEYVEPTERMKNLARAFAEAGATMVIGSHPHVVQKSEIVNGTHVYYSLGNFVFDQYWNEEVSTGLLLRVKFTKDGVKRIEEVPIKMHRDGRTCLLESVNER